MILEHGLGLVEVSCDIVKCVIFPIVLGPLSCVWFGLHRCTRLVMQEFAIICRMVVVDDECSEFVGNVKGGEEEGF